MQNIEKDNNIGVKYRDLLSEKNYILETISKIISRFGDGIDTIAFSLLIYAVTGSTLLVATLFAVNGIPNLIFGMISGVACKYVPDKKIMAICDLGRFTCVLLIAILFATGNLEVWHLYIITFLNSSFESFREPASMSIIPKILPQEKLEHGLAFSSSGCKTAELIGLAMAPLIISLIGIGGAIFIDAITFLICGLLITIMKLKSTVSDEKITIKGTINDLKEGFLFIKKETLILIVVIFAAVLNALVVPLNALQAPYVEEVLGVGSSALSVISIGILLGMTVAGIFAPKLKEKLGNRKMFIFGGILIGITYLVMAILGNIHNYQLMYLALSINVFLLGIGVILLTFTLQITLMKTVEQEFLPRVVAIFNAGALCATPIAACIIGIISEFINIKSLFLIFGVLVAIVFSVLLPSKTVKRFDEC